MITTIAVFYSTGTLVVNIVINWDFRKKHQYVDSENNDEKKVSEVSHSQFVHPQSNEGGSACVHVCLPAKLYKQNQETCKDGRLMHVCKGFSEKLCDGSPVPRVYACVKKGAVEGGGGGGGGGGG